MNDVRRGRLVNQLANVNGDPGAVAFAGYHVIRISDHGYTVTTPMQDRVRLNDGKGFTRAGSPP